MKTPVEYLAGHVFEARRPHRPLQPVVALADAERAVAQALADAEHYKYLLLRALRHQGPRPQPASLPETPVALRYPMAA